jgi:arsenate reductase (thioredoxin)
MITNVLFLCTGNSVRSQMAEAFLRELGGGDFFVKSAGLEPKGLNPLTVQVMAEVGYDLSGQRSKSLDEFLGRQHFHYIITVCDDADRNCPRIWPGVHERLHWSFEDPAAFNGTEAEKLNKFRQVRDQIQAKIRDWLFQTKK